MNDLAWYREWRTQRRIKWLGLLTTMIISLALAIPARHYVFAWTGLHAFSISVEIAAAFSVGWLNSAATHWYCQKRWKKWKTNNQGES